MQNKSRGKIHNKRSRQLGSIERDVLSQLSLGDFLYSMLLSGTSNKQFFKLARERANYRYRCKRAIERLIENKFIRAEGERLSITGSGRYSLGYAVTATRDMLKNGNWDHKWRIVAFDIPERFAALRDKVREILKRAGFEKLQQSIWIFPYECEELVLLIQEESMLSKYILYGVLERIGDEDRLKRKFGLR